MKAYTDLEQSKRLAEILPLKSADMHYSKDFDGSWFVDLAKYTSVKVPKYMGNIEEHLLPCWSLAALLEELNRNCWNISLKCCGAEWDMTYDDGERYISISSDYAIDACVAMIEKLHELKML